MITRRQLVAGTACAALACGATKVFAAAATLTDELGRIEGKSGGRLGVAILDTGSLIRTGHRSGEGFPMCSTFKFLAAAAILKRVDRGEEHLDRRIKFQAADVVVNSPVTKNHAGDDGMTLAELCAAAMNYSDNTAGNLMLANIGGPAALTAFARAIGDQDTRLDRTEPDLNEAVPGDPRDTTTPAAMLGNLQKLVFEDMLSARSKDQLTKWLIANRTGDTRLRAGLPAGWRCGDKTGSGERGSTNDIGVLWPPQRPPLIVTIYLTETSAGSDARNATLADVGRAVAAAFAV
jgi:beta-lactamase class A